MRIAMLEELAEDLDKRAYFTINSCGEIKIKEMNYAIPLAAFCEDEEFFKEELPKLADKVERTKIDKIERFSNKSVEELKDKFYKLLANGSLDFAKRYAKELFLKDSEEFYRAIYHFALMDSTKNMKPLMVISMKKLLGKNYNEKIMYLVIAYLTKKKSNFYQYENALPYEGTLEMMKEKLLKNQENVQTKEFLQIYTSILALSEYDFPQKSLLIGKINEAIENFEKKENKTVANEIENKLINSLLS
jgi:hypothetical protein